MIQGILSLNELSRETGHWPLFGPKDLEARLGELPRWVDPRLITVAVPVWKDYFGFAGSKPKAMMGSKGISREKVVHILCQQFPALPAILEVGGDRVLVAGGAVLKAVVAASKWDSSKLAYHPFMASNDGDVDIFLIGVDESEVEQFMEEMSRCFQAKGHQKLWILRTRHVIQFSMEGEFGTHSDYQFILRNYPNPGQVLGGFDLGVCSCGLNDKHLWFTELAMFSLATELVIADGAQRSTSYEHRIKKYNNRGFRVVFPSFDFDVPKDQPLRVGELELFFKPERQIWIMLFCKDETDDVVRKIRESDYDSETRNYFFGLSYVKKMFSTQDPQHVFSETTCLAAETIHDLFHRPHLPGKSRIRWFLENLHMQENEGPVRSYYGDGFEERKIPNLEAAIAETREKFTMVEEQCFFPVKFWPIDRSRKFNGAFRPVEGTAAEWYSPSKYYRPTKVGLPSLEHVFLLKTLFLKYRIPRDIQNVLVRYLIIVTAQEALKQSLT
jgi:hypothetical protein